VIVPARRAIQGHVPVHLAGLEIVSNWSVSRVGGIGTCDPYATGLPGPLSRGSLKCTYRPADLVIGRMKAGTVTLPMCANCLPA
jgi:hypothetical protein